MFALMKTLYYLYFIINQELNKYTMAYYNNTNLKGIELSDAVTKACKQDDKVLLIFRKLKEATRSEVENLYCEYFDCAPTSSIVRSINTLDNSGLIVKTFLTRQGNYGRSQSLYTIK